MGCGLALEEGLLGALIRGAGLSVGGVTGAGELDGFVVLAGFLAIQSSKKPVSDVLGGCEARLASALGFVLFCGKGGSGALLGAFGGIFGIEFWSAFGGSCWLEAFLAFAAAFQRS